MVSLDRSGEMFYDKRVYHRTTGVDVVYIAPDLLGCPGSVGSLRVFFFDIHTQKLVAELDVTAHLVNKRSPLINYFTLFWMLTLFLIALVAGITKKVLKYDRIQSMDAYGDQLLVTARQYSFLFKYTRSTTSDGTHKLSFELTNHGLDFGFDSGCPALRSCEPSLFLFL